MTFTYDESNLTTLLALTRFKIGDTQKVLKNKDGTLISGLLSDEEIEVELNSAGLNGVDLIGTNFRTAVAVKCVKRILAKLGKEQDTDGAGIRANRTQKTQQYRDILEDLELEMLGEITIDHTGTSIAEERALKSDTDWKGAIYEIGQDDHPGTADQGRRQTFEDFEV